MICPKCKAMLPNGLISCTKCGAVLQPNYKINDSDSSSIFDKNPTTQQTNTGTGQLYRQNPYGQQPNAGTGQLYGKNPYGQQPNAGTGQLYGQNPYGQQPNAGTGQLYGQNPYGQQPNAGSGPLYGQPIYNQQQNTSSSGYWDNGKWVPDQQQRYYNTPNQNAEKKPGCLIDGIIAICLFFTCLAPIGIILMWVYKVPRSLVLRVLATVLFGGLFIFAIAFYGNDSSDETNSSYNSSSNTVVETTTEATTEAETEEITTEEEIVATVTDAIIYEGNDVTVELKSLEGNTLKFYIENNSSKNLSTSLHAYAINGYMADNNMFDMSQSIAANSKANISFKIPKKLESGYEVKEIKRMDFLIWFYDDEASFKDFDTGVLTVETNLADGNLDNDIGDEELLNENNISYKLVDKNEDKVVIGINNNSDTYMSFDGKNVVVNGYSLDTTYNLDVYDKIVFPECSYPMTFEYDWDSDTNFKEDNDINLIENVTLNFGIRPNEDFFSETSSSQMTIDYTSE